MLHLNCTAKLARALKIKLSTAPAEKDLDWLDCWYVRDIPLDFPLDALLFTNVATHYSLVHPFDRRESIDEVIVVFQQRLAGLIGNPIPIRPKPYKVCKTSSRRVLSCMNEQVYVLLYEVERQRSEEGVQFEEIEEHLNAGISGGLFPQAEFKKYLGQGAATKTKPTKSPHMRIVED
jgi:hypothetical protein